MVVSAARLKLATKVRRIRRPQTIQRAITRNAVKMLPPPMPRTGGLPNIPAIPAPSEWRDFQALPIMRMSA